MNTASLKKKRVTDPAEAAASRMADKRSKKTFFIKWRKWVEPARWTGYSMNVASFYGAFTGALVFISFADASAYYAAFIIFSVLAAWEYASHYTSDKHWDNVALFDKNFTLMLPLWIIVFTVCTILTCGGIYKKKITDATPDPYFTSLRKELQENKATVTDLLAIHKKEAKADNNLVGSGKDKGKTYAHILTKQSKEYERVILPLKERNLEINKLLKKSTVPLTPEYAAHIIQESLLFVFLFLSMAVIYQFIKRFVSKYDADAYMNLQPIQYLAELRDEYPHAGSEEWQEFVTEFLNEHPVAKENYFKAKRERKKSTTRRQRETAF